MEHGATQPGPEGDRPRWDAGDRLRWCVSCGRQSRATRSGDRYDPVASPVLPEELLIPRATLGQQRKEGSTSYFIG